jgi:hypothetical protein
MSLAFRICGNFPKSLCLGIWHRDWEAAQPCWLATIAVPELLRPEGNTVELTRPQGQVFVRGVEAAATRYNAGKGITILEPL